MSDKVVKLLPNNALAIDREDLADRVAEMADRIRAGEFPDLDRVVILLDVGRYVDNRTYGRQCNTAELVGILEYAKARIIHSSYDEE